jgi:hypothetical protein
MPRLSKKAKAEWSFFINPLTGKRQFNLLCQHCACQCKQSYRTQILACPNYRERVQTDATNALQSQNDGQTG